MENIVDYLIVLFFVISLLSSFFKKKKRSSIQTVKTKQSRSAMEMQRNNARGIKPIEQKGPSQKKGSSFDNILKAMLEVPEPVVKEKSEVDAYYEEALKNSAMMEEGTNKEETDSVVKNSSLSASIEYQKNQNTYLSTLQEHHKKHINKKAMKIRKDLRNNQTIKDYIVMGEILGKPMALRE
ncbi:hypothetical protein MNBD_IGNAVI01-1940 [hydrothermal vent metagenome]|uniref:Uncharacterized protein n=1 Tax=hydrothermal vent metagenome TaxID=652676 RepID=A0A3B1BTX0_9ZZZZ